MYFSPILVTYFYIHLHSKVFLDQSIVNFTSKLPPLLLEPTAVFNKLTIICFISALAIKYFLFCHDLINLLSKSLGFDGLMGICTALK